MDKENRKVISFELVKELAAKKNEKQRQAEIQRFIRKCELLYEKSRTQNRD